MPTPPRPLLNVHDHRRDSAGLTYVYPVVSRRAGGVSVGINLNTNNACNWACVYCQVPDLKRGGPPPVDLALLADELRFFLGEIIDGDFMQRQVPENARQLVDLAFSGNGEPTSAAEFAQAVDLVGSILTERSLAGKMPVRLITNGSLLHREGVRKGIARIGEFGGEVWFKLDRATASGIAAVNGVALEPLKVERALRQCATLAPTWIQTCYFMTEGREVAAFEQQAYLDFLNQIRDEIKGVHLYGIARPSLQPGAGKLSSPPAKSLEDFAKRIAALGIRVVCQP